MGNRDKIRVTVPKTFEGFGPRTVPIIGESQRSSGPTPISNQNQELDRNKVAQFLPEARPERTAEQKVDRQKWVDNIEPSKVGFVLLRRHRTPEKFGAIITPASLKDVNNKLISTGTVLKMVMEQDGSFPDRNGNPCVVNYKEGSYVLFSPYAPFNSHPNFPEIQCCHAEDILAVLHELPPDVVDD